MDEDKEDEVDNIVRQLSYFWEKKRDPTSHCDWEKWLPILEEHRPDIVDTWRDYNRAIKKLDIAFR